MLKKMGEAAKAASREIAVLGTKAKNAALTAIADALDAKADDILSANAQDIDKAKHDGMSSAMLDRLTLSHGRIRSMAGGVREVAGLDDPVGQVIGMSRRPNGMTIGQRRVPLGVIGIIFESRPNVTVDAAALCLKAGNAVILRGGKEAISSNMALADIMRGALADLALNPDIVQLVSDTSRQSAQDMMALTGCIDLLIPRGGAGLIRAVVEHARVPVVETGVGNCHIYADSSADCDMAASIIYNAKCSRPSVCNAAETLLVHADIASRFLPMAAELLARDKVELRGCPKTIAILGGSVKPASDEDYYTEFLDFILAIRVVDSFDEAVEHISKYSSGHSEAIVTGDYRRAQDFLDRVDSAAVYINASTRFTDGNEFGLGAEIGISTQKMHARGPMGLRELTSSKFVIFGDGQIRI